MNNRIMFCSALVFAAALSTVDVFAQCNRGGGGGGGGSPISTMSGMPTPMAMSYQSPYQLPYQNAGMANQFTNYANVASQAAWPNNVFAA